jgi:hypothetical protein
VTGLETIGGALTALKALTGIAKDINNIEFNQKIIELQQDLLEIQEKFSELQNQNFNLREENRNLKTQQDLGNRVVFHDGACWEIRETGKEEGPFCPSCWTDSVLHRAEISYVEAGQVQFVCTRHRHQYTFRVPEQLVNIGNLSSYKSDDVTMSSSHDYFGGPQGWMG